jgi:peptide/nickel transport system permease protein/nickel transport system permease protein
MMREGQAYFQSASWLVVAPGAAIVLSVVVFSFIGDQLGDRRRTR